LLTKSIAIGSATLSVMAGAAGPDSVVSERVKLLTHATPWKPVATIPVNFNTQHPQGMVKIGDTFFVSSVEIKTPTKRFAQPQGGYDRDTGEGVGHLYRFDAKGALVTGLVLGEGSIYHPGGIDYDGRYIWVPVAEYRPNSRAIIYRVVGRRSNRAKKAMLPTALIACADGGSAMPASVRRDRCPDHPARAAGARSSRSRL
jgi:Family of unknown function (DUF6454)